MSSASANSWSVAAPSTNEPITSSEAIGNNAVMDVLRVRMSTWLSESFTIWL